MNERAGPAGAAARSPRCVESIIAGLLIRAHADFRCCVTMNEDASTYEVPDYILSRLQPTLGMGFPTRDDELAILRYHLPFAPADMLALTVEFLQEAHQLSLEYSVRDGIHLLQYALKTTRPGSCPSLGRRCRLERIAHQSLGRRDPRSADPVSQTQARVGRSGPPARTLVISFSKVMTLYTPADNGSAPRLIPMPSFVSPYRPVSSLAWQW